MENSFSNITAIVITYNEEDNIRRTLDALVQLPEVIVLDSGSVDSTEKIAKEYPNVKFIIRPFDNLMNQWNYGHTLTEKKWILSLDADYRLSPQFLDELAQLDLSCAAYEAPFRYCIQGIPLHSTLLPARPVLYDKTCCTYTQDGHAQWLNVNGSVGHIKNPIFHDDRKSLSRWLSSQQVYADQEMQKLFEPQATWKGADRLRMKTVLAPFLIFLYTYFIKGGIRDGRKGLFYAFQRMYAELLLLLKRLDRELQARDAGKK